MTRYNSKNESTKPFCMSTSNRQKCKAQNLSASLAVTALSFEYTFPAGDPKMRLQRESLAILMLEKDPNM